MVGGFGIERKIELSTRTWDSEVTRIMLADSFGVEL
jgi:hypothetical protein